MRRRTWFTGMVCLLALALIGVATAAPLPEAQQKAQEAQSPMKMMQANQPVPMKLFGTPTGSINLDELDDILFTDSFDYEAIDDAITAGWNLSDGSEDGITWFISSDAAATNHNLDDTAPFIWVDSDDAGSGVDMDEYLTSPVIDASGYEYLYLIFNTYINTGSATFNNNGSVEVSTNGTDWTAVQTWSANSGTYQFYPIAIDLSDLEGDPSTFQFRFHFWDGGSWGYYWGVDEVTVFGSDTPGDFEPPTVSITSGPNVSFEGQDETILAIATDDVGLESVTLSYGLFANGNITDLTTVEMVPTLNEDEYSAIIPGTFASVEDTVVYSVTVTDGAENEARDPATPTSWYGYVVYPQEFNIQMVQLPDYDWIDITTTGTNFGFSDDASSFVVFADYGFETFSWYGEEFTQLRVTSNGWMSFGDYNLGTIYTSAMPNTSTPNAIIAPCGADLNPARTGSGNVWAGMADGKLVLTWDNVYFYGDTAPEAGPHMQLVLDPETGQVRVNYEVISGFLNADETPYTRTHVIGFENGDGTIGYTYYQGNSFEGGPPNQSSWLIARVGGSLVGHVYEADGTTPIESAEVTVYSQAEPPAIVASTTTDETGAYGFDLLTIGMYDVEFVAAEHVTQLIEDVEILSGEETVVDVNLDLQDVLTVIQGYVYDADSGVENDPIEGIGVRLVQLDLTTTTDANGFFSFGEQVIGTYRFDISFDPVGSNGFHDASYPGTVIEEENDDLAFTVNQILPPRNLAGVGDVAQVVLSWNAPLNHETVASLTVLAERLQSELERAEAKAGITAQQLADLQAKLQHVENLLGQNELDDIGDLEGYRIRVDGDILPALAANTSYTVTGLVNGQDYQFEVAADYGYGEDYLVFSAPVTVAPYSFFNEVAMEWVEISETGVALTLSDDGETELLPMNGTWFHYGESYNSIRIGANGATTFNADDEVPYIVSGIPNTGEPNNTIAPYWIDLNPASASSNGVWYLADQVNNRFIVTWDCFAFQTESIIKMQMILDFSDYTMTFQYHSASLGWTPGSWGAAIGIENVDGTEGISYPIELVHDGYAIQASVETPDFGTIIGNFAACDEAGDPIEGVAVRYQGNTIGTSEADGSFEVSLMAGDVTLSFTHPDFWSVEGYEVTVPVSDEVDLGTIVLTQPNPSVNTTTLSMDVFIEDLDPVTSTFELSNDGCGRMDYTASLQLLNAANQVISSYPINSLMADYTVSYEPGSDPTQKAAPANLRRGPVANPSTQELDELWDLLESFETRTISGSTLGMLTAWIDGNSIYTMEWQAPYTVYEIDFNGNLLGSVTPSTGTAQWWNEIDYDPTTGSVYTIAANGALFQMAADGSGASQIGTVGQDAWAIAFDFDNQKLYWANGYEQTDWGVLDFATGGNTILPSPPMGELPYAMMYVPNEPNGYTILGAFNDVDALGQYIGPVDIYGYDPTTQSWSAAPIRTLYSDATNFSVSGMTGAVAWSDNYDILVATQGGANGNTLDIYEGSPLQTWLTIDPSAGTLLQGESATIGVTVDIHADDNFNPVHDQQVSAQVVISGPHMADVVVTVEMLFSSSVGEEALIPVKYALHQNFPNPFNPSTAIKFDLVASQQVKLTVFNMLGQEVARLVDGQMQAGYHKVSFDASTLSSGVYFYRLETPAFTKMRKMVLVK